MCLNESGSQRDMSSFVVNIKKEMLRVSELIPLSDCCRFDGNTTTVNA